MAAQTLTKVYPNEVDYMFGAIGSIFTPDSICNRRVMTLDKVLMINAGFGKMSKSVTSNNKFDLLFT